MATKKTPTKPRPSTKKPSTRKPAAKKPSAKNPSTRKPSTEKPASPKKPGTSFAALVRKHMAAALPGWPHLETGGGSGPLISFQRPTPEQPRLRELVVFQKGLHGADWLRVNLFPVFLGEGVAGATLEHTLWEGEHVGRDAAWTTAEECDAIVQRACAGLEQACATFFAPYEQAYPRFEALLGPLVQHYLDWLAASGSRLPPQDFVAREEGPLPAFDAWRSTLGERLEGLPGELETPLWRFWHGGRPMRREDYHPGDYYDCARCGAFTAFARGRVVPSADPRHHAFVCKKHG